MNRIAIVTGAAMGNGYGIARKLCEKNYTVMLFDMSDNVYDAEKQLTEAGYSVKAFKCNITDKDAIEGTVKSVINEFGRIDILVNNAGVAKINPFEQTSDELLDLHIDVNIKGSWHMTQAVIPYMRNQHYGRIIIISSVTGTMVCDKGYSAYALTKAGLIGLTKAIAAEYAEYGITCNAICPGFILTPNVRRSAATTCPEDPQSVLDGIAAGIPMKKLGTPEQVGSLAAFLASDDAEYITGTSNVIDGGNLIPETNVMGIR